MPPKKSQPPSTLNPQRSTLNSQPSDDYRKKKEFYSRVLTIYGRNPVLEALEDEGLEIHRLHLSRSNRPSREIRRMEELAKRRGIEVRYHDKQALSRISKNARQDQGVALDIVAGNVSSPEAFTAGRERYRILALDRITNPQNVGMILRSAAAGKIDAVMIPARGNAPVVSPLTIKASAGTLFRIPILRCDDLAKSLERMREEGAGVYVLDSHAARSFDAERYPERTVLVLGNESDGVSPEVRRVADRAVSIPMNRGVESLNVAVAAALLAFCG